MIGVGMFEMMIMFVMVGLFGLPLSVPPAEPDPYLSQVAPADPIYYVQWSGVELPEGNVDDYQNQTLKLVAEPEVKHLVKRLNGILDQLLVRVRQTSNPNERSLALFMAGLGKQMLLNPTSLAIEELQLAENGLEGRGALLVRVNEERAELEKQLAELCDVVLVEEYGWQVEVVPIKGQAFRKITINPAAPVLWLGFHRDYFFAGIGANALQEIVAREGQEPPAWLTQMRVDLKVDRPATMAYLDVAKVRDRVVPIARMIPEANMMLQAAGIENLQTYRCITGLEGNGFAIRTHLATDGELQFLKFFSPAPISPDDLQRVPADAPAVIAMKLDAMALGNLMAPVMGIVDFEDVLEEISDEISRDLGIGVEELLTDVLGDTVVIYAAPKDGGLIAGWIASLPVNSPMEAEMVLGNAMEMLERASGGTLKPEVMEVDGVTVYVVESMPESPFRFTFAVTQDQVLASLFPQPLLAHLRRSSEEPSLADNPLIASAYSADDMQGGGLRLAMRIDHAELIKLSYPMYTLFARQMFSGIQDEEFDLNVMDLPSTGALTRHLDAATIILVREDDGYHWEVRQTVPTGDLLAAAPLYAASVAPAVIGARAAAGRAQSMNNMKQIALAWHNFHEVHRGFPARASVDNQGNELLSWRVHILPYIEQNALYEQFHLDEPWDSEHNRKLIEMMPEVYARPGTDPTEGLTSYLANGTENGLAIPAKRAGGVGVGIGIGQIQDGTANTAMLVEVNDDNRVIWTQPGDFDGLGMETMSRLIGNWKRGWLVGMADGSVSVARESMSEADLEGLFDRRDNNAPNYRDE